MRRTIKRLLKKYDYPPIQAKKALEIVMRQAEKMCGNQVEYLPDRAADGDVEYDGK